MRLSGCIRGRVFRGMGNLGRRNRVKLLLHCYLGLLTICT